MTTAGDETWITSAELAARLQISPETVRDRVAEGEWPAGRIGRHLRFSPDHVQQIGRIISQPRKRKRRGSDRHLQVADALASLTA